MTPESERVSHMGGETWGCEVEWTHQHFEGSLMNSISVSGPLHVNVVSCWCYQGSPAACPFQLTMLGTG